MDPEDLVSTVFWWGGNTGRWTEDLKEGKGLETVSMVSFLRMCDCEREEVSSLRVYRIRELLFLFFGFLNIFKMEFKNLTI